MTRGSKLKKVCNCCGMIQPEIPKNARPWLDDDGNTIAWCWECVCGSTMFVKV